MGLPVAGFSTAPLKRPEEAVNVRLRLFGPETLLLAEMFKVLVMLSKRFPSDREQ